MISDQSGRTEKVFIFVYRKILQAIETIHYDSEEATMSPLRIEEIIYVIAFAVIKPDSQLGALIYKVIHAC